MKKIFLCIVASLLPLCSFAYGEDVNSSGMSGFAIFSLLVMIAYIVLSIVVLVRWWTMTSDVSAIRQHLTESADPKLTYLVAIGEHDKVQKVALKKLVDLLYPIYYDYYHCTKAASMNKILEQKLPKMYKLGVKLPDYITSGEKFIDYMNSITGNNVVYEDNGKV